MEIEDIRDKRSLERWLKDRPSEDALAIAHRSALRVAPLWFRAMEKSWARERDLTAMPILRINLSLGVARKMPTPKVTFASASAARASAAGASASAFAARASASASAASASASASASAAASAARASDAAAASASADHYAEAAPQIWEQVREDARLLVAGEDLHTTPLWSIPYPDWFTTADTEGRAIWAKEPEVWDFWVRWWDGVLAGKPLPWDLQEQVALIDYEDWEKGPAHIAGVIRGIEEEFELRQMVKEIKSEFPAELKPSSVAKASIEHRSHNNPPELLENAADLRDTVGLIWLEVEAADIELKKSTPDRLVLRSIGVAIAKAIKACATYFGKKLDSFLDRFAEEAGKRTAGAVFELVRWGLIYKFAEKLVGLTF